MLTIIRTNFCDVSFIGSGLFVRLFLEANRKCILCSEEAKWKILDLLFEERRLTYAINSTRGSTISRKQPYRAVVV